MQFLVDMCKSMNIEGYLSIDDLYELSEEKIIEKSANCEEKYIYIYIYNVWLEFSKTDKVYSSKRKVKDKYCVNVISKTRYVVPLVVTDNKTNRISEVSKKAKEKLIIIY